MNLQDILDKARAATRGPWIAVEQRGAIGNCLQAQVFRMDGKSLLCVDSTDKPDEANRIAAHIAAANPESIERIILALMKAREALELCDEIMAAGYEFETVDGRRISVKAALSEIDALEKE